MQKKWKVPLQLVARRPGCGELISLQQELISPSCTIARERLFELPHSVRRRRHLLSLLLWATSYVEYGVFHHPAPYGTVSERRYWEGGPSGVRENSQLKSNPTIRVTVTNTDTPSLAALLSSTGEYPLLSRRCRVVWATQFVCMPQLFRGPCCPPVMSGFHQFGSRPWCGTQPKPSSLVRI